MIRFAHCALAGSLIAWAASLGSAAAQTASVEIAVKNHAFQPAEITAPANRPIALHVKNLDAAAIEFESVELRVERVIDARGSDTIALRPLQPGRYSFFDDFNPATKGVLVVK